MSTKANKARDKKRRDDAAEAKAKAKAKEEATAKAEAEEEEEEASASSNEEGGEDEADEEAGSNGDKGTSNKTALQEVMTTFVNDSMELVIRVNKGEKITEKEKGRAKAKNYEGDVFAALPAEQQGTGAERGKIILAILGGVNTQVEEAIDELGEIMGDDGKHNDRKRIIEGLKKRIARSEIQVGNWEKQWAAKQTGKKEEAGGGGEDMSEKMNNLKIMVESTEEQKQSHWKQITEDLATRSFADGGFLHMLSQLWETLKENMTFKKRGVLTEIFKKVDAGLKHAEVKTAVQEAIRASGDNNKASGRELSDQLESRLFGKGDGVISAATSEGILDMSGGGEKEETRTWNMLSTTWWRRPGTKGSSES